MARDVDLHSDAAGTQAARLLRVWLSPSFPVGGFAYSHGLETAIAHDQVDSRDALIDWLAALVTSGSLRNDIVLLAAAWRQDASDTDINALALALQPSAERYLETAQQGTSFVATITTAWPCPDVSRLRAAVNGDVAYPVAVGVAARGHGVPLRDTAHAYALGFVQALVSAAIRLSLIGQTDGQRVIAALFPFIDQLADASPLLTRDDLGGACFSADLAALEHETLYTRLFRS